MKFRVFSLMMIMSFSALANVSVECGKDVSFEDGTVGIRTFLLSSQDDIRFVAYDSRNKKILGQKISTDPYGNLVLAVSSQQGLGGPVGDKYVIENFSGKNFTKAHHYILGGFAGGNKVETLDCVVSEM